MEVSNQPTPQPQVKKEKVNSQTTPVVLSSTDDESSDRSIQLVVADIVYLLPILFCLVLWVKFLALFDNQLCKCLLLLRL